MSIDVATVNTQGPCTDPWQSLRTALVHHWLVTRRGGERVLEQFAALFPEAPIFTLVYDHDKASELFPHRRINPSALRYLPKAARYYPYLLPFFPWATQHLDLSGYKLVITSDAATLKGVRTDPDAIHICYCHTPMRYVWSGCQEYRNELGPLGRIVFAPLAAALRRWDCRAARGVAHFIANSQNVAWRIRCYYGRQSTIIYPPVDTDYFSPPPKGSADGDYFLHVSQLVSYKRADLIVEAFNRSGLPLVLIGEGSERKKLMRVARPNIRFLGSQPDAVVREAMRGCRALVFAGEEDFGIVLAEAQACGKPVIAFDRGGAREIVADGKTGILFGEQSVDSLLKAFNRFEKLSFQPEEIRDSALRFGVARFLREFTAYLVQVLNSREGAGHSPDAAIARAL